MLSSLVNTSLVLFLAGVAGLAITSSGEASPATGLIANLPYGRFQGAYDAEYNISFWQKIPFAAPPTGENRFRAPQPPADIPGIYDSSQPFDMCPQRTVNGSEDCLYLGLYSRPWEEGMPLRPVVVVFYGGAFIQGSAYFDIPPSAYPVLNVSNTSDIIFVYPNYRVNAFGFLPGREVAEDETSDTNAGLRDQEAAILWARRYVRAFGGDAGNMAIWGQSAGGGSVVAQVLSHAGRARAERNFEKALASSPFWPKTYRYDSGEAQWIYDTMVNRTGCAGEADTLRCLKAADVQSIRDASLHVASSHTYNTSSYTWAPVVGDDFLPVSLTELVDMGGVGLGDGFSVFNTHEGQTFVPSDVDFDEWVEGFLPGLSDDQLARVGELYPAAGGSEMIPSYNTSWVRAGLVYRDVVLACPGHWMAGAIARSGGGSSWQAEYAISPARHASDTYWWNSINPAQQTDPLHYKGYTGALASFLATGDPNIFKLTGEDVPGVPNLKVGKELVITEDGFEQVDISRFRARCAMWKSFGPSVPV